MAEISQVRMAVPELATLSRILREGGAQAFPQWLSTEPGDEPRIVRWGVSGVAVEALDVPDDPGRAGLFPRPVDDWTDASPRGLVLATVDTGRAIADLAAAIGSGWTDAGDDPIIGARCRRMPVGRSVLVLAEPSTEGYAAACLARFGEGPIAVALGGTSAGRAATRNPVTGGAATYVRIGPGTAPTLIFLPPQA